MGERVRVDVWVRETERARERERERERGREREGEREREREREGEREERGERKEGKEIRAHTCSLSLARSVMRRFAVGTPASKRKVEGKLDTNRMYLFKNWMEERDGEGGGGRNI